MERSFGRRALYELLHDIERAARGRNSSRGFFLYAQHCCAQLFAYSFYEHGVIVRGILYAAFMCTAFLYAAFLYAAFLYLCIFYRGRKKTVGRNARRFFLFARLELNSQQSGHTFDQIDGAAAVTPFVIVPGEDFDHIVADDVGPFGDEDRAVAIAFDVAQNDRVFVIIENAFHGAESGFFHGGVDGVFGDRFAGIDGQVNDASGGGRNAERNTGEFAFDRRNDDTDRFGGAGGGRNDIHSGGTSAIDIFVGDIEDDLVVRIGVNGGHEALVDTEFVVEDFDDRREAVGRAGGV